MYGTQMNFRSRYHTEVVYSVQHDTRLNPEFSGAGIEQTCIVCEGIAELDTNSIQ